MSRNQTNAHLPQRGQGHSAWPQSTLGNPSSTADELRQKITALTATGEAKDATIRDLQNRVSDCQRQLGRIEGELKEALKESQALRKDRDSLESQLKLLTAEGDRYRSLIKNQKEHIERNPSQRRNHAPLPEVQYRQPGAAPASAAVQHPHRQLPTHGHPHHAEQAIPFRRPSPISGSSSALTATQWGMSDKPIEPRQSSLQAPTMTPQRLLSPSSTRQGVADLGPPNNQSHPQYQPADSERSMRPSASFLNVGQSAGVAPSPSEMGSVASRALVPQDSTVDNFDPKASTIGIFQQIKEFCKVHVLPVWPDIKELPKDLQNHLHHFCPSSSILGEIMKNNETRHFLAARLLFQYAVRDVWKIAVVKDVPWPDKLAELSESRKIIKSTSDQGTAAIHHQLMAEAMQAIRQHPSFASYIVSKAAQNGQTLAPLLAPMVNIRGQGGIAFNELWRSVHVYGVDLHTLPQAYHFDLPPGGPKAFFNPSSMVSIDPGVSAEPSAIKQADYRVSVTIAPGIQAKKSTPEKILVETVCKSEVLLYLGQ